MQWIASWPLTSASPFTKWPAFVLLLASLISLWATGAHGMTDDQISSLRHETLELFYHGFDNYMNIAFPEDELKPLSCQPKTRNRENPADIGVNDVLGNYSLTLIDSLSTLAILASGPQPKKSKRNPLRDFQDGVKSLVDLYGDGTDKKRCGTRACGFNLNSKVQVFETNIRGVGGLLSAHLFAAGYLPIAGYAPAWKDKGKNPGIKWKNGLMYNRQLLDLALDLASRLLPAFSTQTGIPYPRVNLRTGIPFYRDADGICRLDGTSSPAREITENCAAGAGSLLLEFSTLSRLTKDMRFERVAKTAFWAIWERRSAVGLLGNGIDAETGLWTTPVLSGIGAGIDSFYEYSIKSHILLSNLPYNSSASATESPDAFLEVWIQAHSAVRRHIYRSSRHEKHPYYSQVDYFNGASRYSWTDNLSAYYPGLLVLAGEIDEAIESHLLFNALWTKYGALPERWTAPNSYIDTNFKHWAGRPEFIESTFHLYQATRDPYYLHVGEMTLRDIKRRCYTKCGWADLGDVNTGEQRDRMESFFLGETAKYLYLLFTPDHPLNKLDRPVVFTTEGHPIMIPDHARGTRTASNPPYEVPLVPGTCPAAPSALPLTSSNVANRADLFHAAAMAQLHLVKFDPARASPLEEASDDSPGISIADIRSPNNYTFHPWTLPHSLIPPKGLSSPIVNPIVSTLTFPANAASEGQANLIPLGALQKLVDGILVNSLSNIRLNMIQEPKSILLPDGNGILVEQYTGDEFRIHGIANWALGRDERVVLSSGALKDVSPTDPHFARHKDLEMVDLLLDIPDPARHDDQHDDFDPYIGEGNPNLKVLQGERRNIISRIFPQPPMPRGSNTSLPLNADGNPVLVRRNIPAILPTGVGAVPLPAAMDLEPLSVLLGRLPYSKIFYLDDTLCHHRLPIGVVKSFQILIISRGGCSFNDKLANMPSFTPNPNSLQLVLIVSSGGGDGTGGLIRPLLDEVQVTPNGVDRRYPIAMAMVDGLADVNEGESHDDGGDTNFRSIESRNTKAYLRRVSSALGIFDSNGKLNAIRRKSVAYAGEEDNGNPKMVSSMGVKRRYKFTSMGVPIGNLMMV